MQRTNPTAARRWAVTPVLALAVMAALIASLMAPATANVTVPATASITQAPTEAEVGGEFDVVANVSGEVSLTIATDLPAVAPEATLTLLASDTEGNQGEPVVDGFGNPDPTASMASDGSGTFTFTGVKLSEDVGVGKYFLKVTVSLGNRVLAYDDTSSLEVVPGFDESVDCTGADCTITFETDDKVAYEIKVDQTTTGGSASVGVNIDLGTAASSGFVDHCNELELANPDRRILPTINQIVPVGFAADQFVTVTVIIPKDVINEDVNRSDKPWTVCFQDEADNDPDGVPPAHPDKGQVRLLDRCQNTDDPACIVTLEKFKGANLKLVFEFPAVDPFFR